MGDPRFHEKQIDTAVEKAKAALDKMKEAGEIKGYALAVTTEDSAFRVWDLSGLEVIEAHALLGCVGTLHYRLRRSIDGEFA